jgi:putative transposase
MPNYRRTFVPGGCWFFTANLLDRRSRLLTDEIETLREATRRTLKRHPFRIDAFVVLPDHIHAIWTLPEGDTDFSTRWRLIKIVFSKAMPATERLSKVRRARGERGIWQRRFWEHLIRDDEDYRRHVEYCYINPVKHGLVSRVGEWPFSSFHRDVSAGLFPQDWAGEFDAVGEFGEASNGAIK